jgi:GNAT superfamily N-acetyltransferase
MEPARMGLNVTLREPTACSSAESAAFRDLVVQGDEVDPDGLEGRIQKAKALVFGTCDDLLVGVAAVKCQERNYRHGIFQKAGISDLAGRYVYELGWIFVVPEFRGKGFSVALVEKSLASFGAENVYSTSKTSNTPMHRTLLKFGFSAEGNPWRSKRGPYDLAMYLRPAPQPSGTAEAPRAARR